MKFFRIFFLILCVSLNLLAYPKVYVTSSNSKVSVLDAGNNTFIQNFTPSSGVTTAIYMEGIAYAQGEQKAYIVDAVQLGIWVIDVETDTADTFVPLNGAFFPTSIGIMPNGAKVYVIDTSGGTVYVMDTATNAVTTITGGAAQPDAVAFNANGAKVYILDRSNGDILVYRTVDDVLIRTISGSNAQEIAVSPLNIGYAPDSNGSDIFTFSAVTDTAGAPISTTGDELRGVDFTSNGLTSYVASNGDSTLQVIQVDTPVAPIPLTASPRRILVNPISPTQVYITTAPSSSVLVVENGTQVATPSFDANLTAARYMEFILKVYPPTGVTGEVIKNKFMLLTNTVNKLTWTASISSNITGYTITRNGEYIKTAISTFYLDQNRSMNVTDIYTIRAQHVDGAVSAPVTISVP